LQKRAVAEAKAMGLHRILLLPNLEFFVFSSIDPTKLTWDLWAAPKSGEGDRMGSTKSRTKLARNYSRRDLSCDPKKHYYRNPPEDTTVEFRNEVCQILDDKLWLNHRESITTK